MRDLSELQKEYNRLTKELIDPELVLQWERFQEISKRRKALEPIAEKANKFDSIQERIEENQQIILAQEDPELTSMAEQELLSLKQQKVALEQEIEDLFREKKESLPDGIIMEIRAGTGGDEASLFAANLYNMYKKYAEQQQWRVTLLNLHKTELGGIREVSFEITGDNVFANLRYEAGVHRVQRIPETEKQGRVHTSTVSVAILPKPKKEEMTLQPADVHMEFTTSSGPGGQNVNKRETAVRLTHIPTGLTVLAESSRTQQANKEAAFALLQARIISARQEAAQEKLSGKRKEQIGSAERAEKIRTYNFPQDRITDHRIKKSWHGIETTLKEGNLTPIIEALCEANTTEAD